MSKLGEMIAAQNDEWARTPLAVSVVREIATSFHPNIQSKMTEEAFEVFINHIRALAWAEGYSHCFDCPEPGTSLADNPYSRKETTE